MSSTFYNNQNLVAIGNVGIGTTNPTQSLTVVGNITASGGIISLGTALSIANGGTGQTTASAAFNALSPMTTAGDLIYGGASGAGTRLATGSATQLLHGGATPTWSAISLTADVSGTLPIANGGTGQTTASAAFNALSPMTSAGDLIYGGASGAGTRLATGSATQLLHGGTTPSWSAISLTADVSGTLPIANGGTGATSTSQNSVFAGPTSGAGAPSFRALVSGDVPTLNQNTTGSAGSLSTTYGTGQILYGQASGVPASTSTFVYSGGNVGIGMASPGYTLDVAGDMHCSGTLSAGNPLMFRNRIINGDMRIWQRGTTTSAVASSYTADRWLVPANSTSWAVTQVAGPWGSTGFQYAIQLVSSTTFTNPSIIEQRVEQYNVADFIQGTPFVVSFWARQTGGTLITMNVQPLLPSATNNFATLTTASTPSVVGVALTSNWQYYTCQFAVSVTGVATNGLDIQFWDTTSISSASPITVQITGVQLEKGSVATPFEVRPYGVELQLCQRYWEQSYSIGTAFGTNTYVGLVQLFGSSDSSGNIVATQRYQVAKRIAVTPTIYTTGGTAGSWFYARSGASGNGTINDNSFSTVFGYNFYIAVGAAWVPCWIQGHWVANAEL